MPDSDTYFLATWKWGTSVKLTSKLGWSMIPRIAKKARENGSMTHPDVRTMGNRVKDLDEGTNGHFARFLEGERTQSLQRDLRGNLKEARGLARLYDRYEKSGYDGLESWWRVKMTEVIAVCENTLSAFVSDSSRTEPVPQAFRALAVTPAE